MDEIVNTSLASRYFTFDGLPQMTGLESYQWKKAILKELVDNALDAIEVNSEKKIDIEYIDDILRIFDNGKGITIEDIKNKIYDFSNSSSSKAYIITPTRGRLGNALMTIIGICYVKGYRLLWHTADGIIFDVDIDAENIELYGIKKEFNNVGTTTRTGIEIVGIDYDDKYLDNCIWQYSLCNPDVTFSINYDDLEEEGGEEYEATIEPINRNAEKPYPMAFYSLKQYKTLLGKQPLDTLYKSSFLNDFFGTQIMRKSIIDGRPRIENLSENDKERDFYELRNALKTKPFTILKKHLLGYKSCLAVEIKEDDSSDITFPCYVEFEINKLDEELENTAIFCFINNSITYSGGDSIYFEANHYKISNSRKDVYCNTLNGLLKNYKDYCFYFHFVCPNFRFTDGGKTRINITNFVKVLVDSLRKELASVQRVLNMDKIKKGSQQERAEEHMTNAFKLASNNGEYSITARQMFYKLRELIGDPDWETNTTYQYFTSDWLTEWLDEHTEYEEKVNFSERGNFYTSESTWGLGSANVSKFISMENSKNNKFTLYGGLQDDIHIDDKNFSIKYKYNKALYIEKTGFDSVFQAEELCDKYNLFIISGQGFGSRSARKLLHFCQQQGLKLYCMHDLDISGVTILSKLREANAKFKYNIEIEDMGVTLDDVTKYGIKPEDVKSTKKARTALKKLDSKYQNFFYKDYDHMRRVELNAFTTRQLLDIIDDKLGGESQLPTVNLSTALEIDNRALREVAFMRLLKDKYWSMLEQINIDCDLSEFDGVLTLLDAKKQIPEIKEALISQYVDEINKRIQI